MLKTLHSKLKRLTDSLPDRYTSFKIWTKTKLTTYRHRFIVKRNSVRHSIVSNIKRAARGVFNAFFETHYNIPLVKTSVAAVGYLFLIELSCLTIIWASSRTYLVSTLHPRNVNEALIGFVTILVALLIPVAVALVEDARTSSLARQTVVKSIIRFKTAPLALSLLGLFLFIPQNTEVLNSGVTARLLYTPVIVACVFFILMSYYRSYRWLSDNSEHSSGTQPDKSSPQSPQPLVYASYKFARIDKLLSGRNGYETWSVVWSQNFPEQYESALHTTFFKRENSAIKSKKQRQYTLLTAEVAAYDRYFDRRNTQGWLFHVNYPKQFFKLLAQVSKVIDKYRRQDINKIEGLWYAKSSLERISKKFIDTSLTADFVADAFDAMDEYLSSADLLLLGSDGKMRNTLILSHFLNTFFEKMFDGSLDQYDLDSYFDGAKYWTVTYDNLYTQRYNVSFVVESKFREWLFKEIDKANKIDRFYKVDSLLELLFPETDPITMGILYWFFYQAQHTTNAKEIVKNNYENPRWFGIGGRSSGFWSDDENQRMDNFRDFQRGLERNSVKLFATMHASYLRRFWKIDEIIKELQALVDNTNLNTDTLVPTKGLLKALLSIQEFYEDPEKF